MKRIKNLLVAFLALISFTIAFSGCGLFKPESNYDKGVKLARGASNVEATQVINSSDNGYTKIVYQCDGDTILYKKTKLNSNGLAIESDSCWFVKQGDKYMRYQSSNESSEIDKKTYDNMRKNLNTGNLIGLLENYGKDTENWSFGFTSQDNLKDGVDSEFCIIFCLGGQPRRISERWGYKDNKLIYKNGDSNNGITYSYDKITLNPPILK